MPTSPKASVIIPAYNSADYTVKTVESVLAQTYTDYELIVVDDGSTDHTREVLQEYLDRIKYIYKDNGGACSARNVGIEMAEGEYVACLDCDDLWLPEKLDHSVAVLEADSALGFMYTSTYTIDADGKTLDEMRSPCNSRWAYKDLLYDNFVLAPTVVIRKSALMHVGLFDERIFIPADWELWLRLAREFPIGYVDLPLSKYRMASNYTLKNVEQFVQESNYVVEKHFRIAGELSTRDRARCKGRLLFVHFQLYRKAGNLKEARRCLKQALRQNPFNWTLYLCLIFSFLGSAARDTTARFKRVS